MARHVVVTGATGLVGRAAMEHFARAGVRTTAVSRREPYDTHGATHLPLDLTDEDACLRELGALEDVTHLVFAALHEEPDLVAGWTSPAHGETNGRMLQNTLESLLISSPGLRHVTLLQGPKAYGVHVRPLRPGAREDRDEDRLTPNFYWVQEDYLRDRQSSAAYTWTIWRPALVLGLAGTGAMNLLAAIGVYAAVLRERGEPLHYPGHPVGSSAVQPTDTDLMARAIDWAGRAPEAADQVFNLTNGETFSLHNLWPVVAEALGMQVGEVRPFRFVEELPGFADDWDTVRSSHGLSAPGLVQFLGQSVQFADFVFGGRAPEGPQGSISTVKVRRAGFHEAMYTDEMLRKWFARYRADGLLPPA
ncbi:NAD-dependent epimerase/dehydratase family protein [Nocardioides marmotae]|uniref:NAD-dependent epimerase/dehydratase family protein n=1 Tax=Nocardioides marmotae TaxID=2663857 RepID=UPI0012B52929|nr:NAD-dependent epimerase/dehydratase family protein [Nocardioides marmotae]MBC9732352.1 NAD-dependent epimerase/dehydratase family protein [Nocardioides marmotae]MTB83473.1 NAD-dependent epimerase/dehydratase family protein [Nocardioides marmotae]